MRSTLTMLFAVLAAAVLSACGAPKCSPSSCAGCCDAQGQCQAGNQSAACGVNGGQCTSCFGGACNFGFCGGTSMGGGNGNTGGGIGSGGGNGSGGGGGTTVTNYREFCEAGLRAQMNYYVRCGYYTRASADEMLTTYLSRCATPQEVFTSGRGRFDAVGAQSCITEYENLSCLGNLSSSACTEAVVGLVALNGSCFSYSECQTGLWCDTASCPGSCKTRVAVGQPTTTTYGEDCAVGAYKYGTVCSPYIALGQSCSPTGGEPSTRTCVPGATCAPNEVCTVRSDNLATGASCVPNQGPECNIGARCVNSVCTAMGDIGAACDNVRLCRNGLQCSDANVCTAPGVAGATCGGRALCGSDFFCNVTGGQSTGTCAPRRPINGTCSNQAHCALGLWCNGTTSAPGTCAAKVGLGGACTAAGAYTACTENLYCTARDGAQTGVCANKKSVGASCGASDECVESANCGSGGVCVRTYCAP